jgi:hypothetical protein
MKKYILVFQTITFFALTLPTFKKQHFVKLLFLNYLFRYKKATSEQDPIHLKWRKSKFV